MSILWEKNTLMYKEVDYFSCLYILAIRSLVIVDPDLFPWRALMCIM